MTSNSNPADVVAPGSDADLTTSSTVRKYQESPLLQLPGELRNAIYDYTLREHYEVILGWDNHRGNHQEYHLLDGAAPAHNHLAILRTCRQIYEETKTTHGELSTFHFRHGFKDWTPPSGVQPIVIYPRIFLNGEAQVKPDETTGAASTDIADAYARWGTAAAITSIRYVVQYELTQDWFDNIDLVLEDIKSAVTPWAQAFVGKTRKDAGAVQGEVNVTITVHARDRLVFTNMEEA